MKLYSKQFLFAGQWDGESPEIDIYGHITKIPFWVKPGDWIVIDPERTLSVIEYVGSKEDILKLYEFLEE